LKNSASLVAPSVKPDPMPAGIGSNLRGVEPMNAFADELLHRIADARQALRSAQDAGELDGERVYAGELDSLLRLAMENGVTIPPELDPQRSQGPS
jgi:hypothetical protein